MSVELVDTQKLHTEKLNFESKTDSKIESKQEHLKV